MGETVTPRFQCSVTLSVLPLVAAAVVGCGDYLGERAQTGECPPDEVCSLITPEGLYFLGPAFGDRGLFYFRDLAPTAVGGTQTHTVYDAETDLPFDFPFTAVVTDDNLVVQSSSFAQVVLYGDQAGSALLRLTDFSDRLFDRVTVIANPIWECAVGPANEEIGSLDGPWVLYPGPTARVVSQIFDVNHHRLVDETMRLYPVDASAVLSSHQDAWDCLSFETTPDATLVEVVSRTGDGGEHVDAVEFQDWVDDIRFLHGLRLEVLHANITHPFPSCFEALGGDTRVFGVPWQFSVTGDATVLDLIVAPWEKPLPPNCMAIQTGDPGEITLTVEVPGISRDYPITVVPTSASWHLDDSAEIPAPQPPGPPGVPGWRARH